MLRISIPSTKNIKSPKIMTVAVIAIGLLVACSYYFFIYETPEECILNELINEAERDGKHEFATKLKEADSKRVASRFLSDATYRIKHTEEVTWDEYAHYGPILEYCNIDIK